MSDGSDEYAAAMDAYAEHLDDLTRKAIAHPTDAVLVIVRDTSPRSGVIVGTYGHEADLLLRDYGHEIFDTFDGDLAPQAPATPGAWLFEGHIGWGDGPDADRHFRGHWRAPTAEELSSVLSGGSLCRKAAPAGEPSKMTGAEFLARARDQVDVLTSWVLRDMADAAQEVRGDALAAPSAPEARPLLEILRGLTPAESCELAGMLDDGTVSAALVREALGAAEKRYWIGGEGWVDSRRIVELGAELAASDAKSNIKLSAGEGEWALPKGLWWTRYGNDLVIVGPVEGPPHRPCLRMRHGHLVGSLAFHPDAKALGDLLRRRIEAEQAPPAYRNPSRLWLLDDGERHWVMAPTEEEALAFWWANCADGHEEDDPPTIKDVTDRAHEIVIRTDEDAGGPPRTARMWMDQDDTKIALIGTTVW